MKARRFPPISLPAGKRPSGSCGVPRRRSGVVVLEFVIAMPLIFFTTLGVFEFVILGLLIHAGTMASLEAAREGAKVFPAALPFDNNAPLDFDPDGNDDVADRVALVAEKYLSIYGLDVEPLPVPGRSTAVVQIKRDPVGAPPMETALRGNNTIFFTQTGVDPNDGELIVTVAFRYVDPLDPTGNGNPLPDWLSFFNFSLNSATIRFQLTSRQALE